MPLSPAQLAQRSAASLSAAAKRRAEGLTERELAQRRINSWNRGAANRAKVNKRRKQLDGNVRKRVVEAGGQFQTTMEEEVRNINRLERVWGIPVEVSVQNAFGKVSFDNPALQSFLKKWTNLRNKGMTPAEAVTRLERRHENVRRRDQLGGMPTMLDLIRENYPIDMREQRRYRKPLTDRQRERKRERDADFRENKRRRERRAA